MSPRHLKNSPGVRSERGPLRAVRLYGVLGRKFGRVFHLAVSTPAEAIRALECQLKGFSEFLATSELRGLRYAVFYGRRNLGEHELHHRGNKQDIRIAPVHVGSKRAGTMQTIIGVVLIIVASMASGGLGASTVEAMYATGASQVMGGIVQMISPQPRGFESRTAQANAPSYAFGGPVNTVAQGNPVGLLYGKRRIGGAIVSAGIYTEDKL